MNMNFQVSTKCATKLVAHFMIINSAIKIVATENFDSSYAFCGPHLAIYSMHL
jgi:hypothetical protein